MSETKDESLVERLDNIAKKLDILIAILLAKSGVTQKEIASILGISDRTIRNWLPFFKEIKQKRKEE